MSTDRKSLEVPDYIANRINERKSADAARDRTLQAMIGESFAFPRLSIKASRYRLIENGVETVLGTTCDVIILDVNPANSKVFYATAYDPKAEDARPDCMSDNGRVPESSIADPINDSCLTCPYNVLGSTVTPAGNKSKKCGDYKHLAVLAASDPSKLYSLTLPVTALKALREYAVYLEQNQAVPHWVVTRLGFDDSESYPKVTFDYMGFLPERHLAHLDELKESEDVQKAIRVLKPDGAPAVTDQSEETPETPEKPAKATKAAKGNGKRPAKQAKPKPEPEPEPVAVQEQEAEAEDATPEAPLTELDKQLDAIFG